MQNYYENLRGRRQFVLGKRYVGVPSWRHTEIRSNILLSSHPELSVEQIRTGSKSVTSLGVVLDPLNPQRSNKEILANLLPSLVASRDSDFECTHTLGGRWLLIVDNAEKVELFGDCFGMRSIVHTENEEPWCASQLGILKENLSLAFDPAAVSYQEACLREGQSEYWFPNTSTLCKEVKSLLPNHALNLESGTTRRFWPCKAFGKTSLSNAVRTGKRLLSGLMEAACARSHVVILMSAGLDSRMVLAAARKARKAVSGLTFVSDEVSVEAADIVVPTTLLSKLKIAHKVVDCQAEMSNEFAELYTSNTVPAHKAYGKIAFGLLNSGTDSYLQVNGSGGELLRAYGRLPDGKRVDVESLLENFTRHPFAHQEAEKWLESVSDFKHVDLMDLFYMEQRIGRWCAEGYGEWDIVHDCFSLFSCRALVETLKGVNLSYQVEPESEMFYAMIRSMWPEVLKAPVNPHKKVKSPPWTLKRAIKNLLVQSHLLDYFPGQFLDSKKKYLPRMFFSIIYFTAYMSVATPII